MISAPPSHDALLHSALAHHQAGRHGSAAALYAQVLGQQPNHPQALHFSGLLAHQAGNCALGLELIHRSLRHDPDNTAFLINLAQVFTASGHTLQAAATYTRALTIDPALYVAHRHLGDLHLSAGRLDEAAAAYAKALALQPHSAEIIHSLGRLFREAGQLERSTTCFRKALTLKPTYAAAHNNLALALQELGHLAEAVSHCRQAIKLQPGLAAAHANLAGMLLAEGDSTAAAESARRALQLDPLLPEAHLNLGNALRRQGRLTAATECYQQAIAVSPSTAAGAYNNLAETYKDQNKLREAVAAFEAALTLQPNFAAARSNLLYLHAFTRDIAPEAERALARQWEQHVLTAAERMAARQRAPASAGVFHARGARLRVGILSAELGTHAVAEFLEPLLEAFDRSRIHLTLFPTTRRSCARAAHFRTLADDFIPVIGLADPAAAELIRTQRIDILVDTTGHTFAGRPAICAHRAAPVQISYIGYWSTTGLTEMDWFFADPNCPPGLSAHFTEALWPLPRIAVCYRGDASMPASRWQPDPAGVIRLGSFNKFSKIRSATLALWAKALQALPEATLVLEDAAEHEAETHHRILSTLDLHGIAAERVEFIPFVPGHQLHMQLYDRLDIALDTIPFNSGTTAFDALWMGVPLVTLEGNWLGGRMGGTVLRSLGRAAWVAQSEAEFVDIVRTLARDVESRKRLRQTQRAHMSASPLCDAPAMARALESAFDAMHARWSAGTS